MSKNTLFSYFSKSPSLQVKPVSKNSSLDSSSELINKSSLGQLSDPPRTPSNKRKLNGKNSTSKITSSSQKDTPVSKKRRVVMYKSDSEEDEVKTPPEKKQRMFDVDSEGDATDDEFKPEEHQESSGDESLSENSEGEPETASDSEHGSPVKGKNKKKTPGKKLNGSAKKSAPGITPAKSKNLINTQSTPSQKEQNGIQSDGSNWPHLKYDFLQPNRIKDIKMRPPNHPDYDSRTVYVPQDFKLNLSPALRQWWEMKAKHFDCVLFFKVGKFYELYHMDAVTGANELNLLYMKGDFAHSGFPETAYAKYSASLVERGYKVARVEQTETPDMMAERCKKMGKCTKFDKVVKREICQLTTKGTRVFTVQDGESVEAGSAFLMALTEKEVEGGKSQYGVCFVDTSIAVFHLGQFTDDKHCSRLRTLFAHYPPAQILFERGQLSPRTKQVLNTTHASILKEQLAPESEFWSSNKTLTTFSERKYFPDKTPNSLKQFLSDSDSLGLTANEETDMAVRALGAVTWYLSRCQLDYQLLSMGQFEEFKPPDSEVLPMAQNNQQDEIPFSHMILDSVTLKNLHVLENSSGGTTGTLLHKLDHCSTHFGKRLLQGWLCNPLTNITSIQARQQAVTQLINQPELCRDIRALMSKLPDLERLLSRIFAQSSRGQNSSHPDSRAIIFGEQAQSKKKINEFISVLDGFQIAQSVAVKMQESGVGESSELLAKCSHFPSSTPPGQFPDLTEHLNFFKNAFDHEEASKEGNIIPNAGVDLEYDEAVTTLNKLEKQHKDYLKSQCELFKCNVIYVGTDKKRFQLEIPESNCRKIPTDYVMQPCTKKKYKRFHNSTTKEFLQDQMKAEETKKNVLLGIRKRIFSRFSERHSSWVSAVQSLAVLDVLISFAEYSYSQELDMCLPQFVPITSSAQAFIAVKNGSYPCTAADEVFIPNDTVIGHQDTISPSLILVTGPNMGGKSTLMRQLALLTIMAQQGCRVPAESLMLSPVDRIFTRIGANDDILAGESTFFTELCETSAILTHATKHSLVLIDELGRGTSTYDGTAIANAVLKQLTQMQCRTLFSTHYHSLVEDFKHCDNVALGHMACMAEEQMKEDSEDVLENVTFLYKFTSGACPKSYGFNAARLAGLPAHITRRGYVRAKALEAECNIRNTFQTIFCKDFKPDTFKQLISAL